MIICRERSRAMFPEAAMLADTFAVLKSRVELAEDVRVQEDGDEASHTEPVVDEQVHRPLSLRVAVHPNPEKSSGGYGNVIKGTWINKDGDEVPVCTLALLKVTTSGPLN